MSRSVFLTSKRKEKPVEFTEVADEDWMQGFYNRIIPTALDQSQIEQLFQFLLRDPSRLDLLPEICKALKYDVKCIKVDPTLIEDALIECFCHIIALPPASIHKQTEFVGELLVAIGLHHCYLNVSIAKYLSLVELLVDLYRRTFPSDLACMCLSLLSSLRRIAFERNYKFGDTSDLFVDVKSQVTTLDLNCEMHRACVKSLLELAPESLALGEQFYVMVQKISSPTAGASNVTGDVLRHIWQDLVKVNAEVELDFDGAAYMAIVCGGNKYTMSALMQLTCVAWAKGSAWLDQLTSVLGCEQISAAGVAQMLDEFAGNSFNVVDMEALREIVNVVVGRSITALCLIQSLAKCVSDLVAVMEDIDVDGLQDIVHIIFRMIEAQKVQFLDCTDHDDKERILEAAMQLVSLPCCGEIDGKQHPELIGILEEYGGNQLIRIILNTIFPCVE